VAEHSGEFNKLLAALTGGAVTHPVPLNRRRLHCLGMWRIPLLDKAVSICGFGIEVPKVAHRTRTSVDSFPLFEITPCPAADATRRGDRSYSSVERWAA